MIKRRTTLPFISTILFLFSFLVSSLSLESQNINNATENFREDLERLISGEIDSLSLPENHNIRLQYFDIDGWQGFNESEKSNYPDGIISTTEFYPISRDEIISISQNRILLVLKMQNGWKTYAATFQTDGTPIEAFLLHNHYGYLYEKNYRAYSFDQPWRYNKSTEQFLFYQLIYGYEPIPSIEEPTKDPIYHQSFHQVEADDSGYFQVSTLNASRDYLFSREDRQSKIHTAEFFEFKIQTVSDANRPETELWSEEHLITADMESHDSLTVYLNYEADWSDQFFFIQTQGDYTVTDVSQSFENVMIYQQDGSICELNSWKTYRSPWTDLHLEDDFFSTQSLEKEQLSHFPEFSNKELLMEIQSKCDESANTESDHRIVTKRIFLKFNYSFPSGSSTKYLTLELATSP